MRRSDVLCVICIFVLATLFLAPALRPGYTLLPLGLESQIAPWHKQVTQQVQNPLLSDPFYTFYPRRDFFTESLQAGTYPLWNPYIFGGHPLIGDTAAQPFYPPNVLAALFLSAARSLSVLAWFHLVLTGVSFFAFLRILELKQVAALFGAVAWMLNANAVAWLENPHRLSTLSWLPAIFLFYELALQRRSLWPVTVAGGLYGLCILGGHTQFALGNGMALGVFALFRAITISRKAGRPVCRPLGIVGVVGLIGVGIGAIQLVPTHQLAELSHRGVKNLRGFLAGAWPLQHLVSLWIPDFHGSPVRPPYWGALNYAEVTVYYGAFAFPLALAALGWVDRATGRFFSLMQAIVILVALGSPLAWVLAWLPWIRYFRLISLIAYVPFFGGAAAAFCLDNLMEMSCRERPRWWEPLATSMIMLGVFTVLVILNRKADTAAHWSGLVPHLWRTTLIWLVGLLCVSLMSLRPAMAGALLVILLAVDLFQWGNSFNPVSPLENLYPENAVASVMRRDPTVFRVLPLQTDRVIFGPNVLSVFGLQEVGGYSSLMVGRYRELVKAIDDEVAIWWMRPNRNMLVNSKFDPLFGFLNVKYVLSTRPLEEYSTMVEVERVPKRGAAIRLAGGERITTTFVGQRPGLNRVDVHFADMTGAPPQMVRFLLWRRSEDGKLVADITVDGADLPDRGSRPFFFAPVVDSKGETFAWGLEVPRSASGGSVWLQPTGEPAEEQPAFTAYSTQLQFVNSQEGVWIYQNPNVLGRAYVIREWEVLPDHRLLSRLASSDFNVWTTALLEGPLPAEQAAALEGAPPEPASAAEVTQYGTHRVEVRAEMTSAGLLVLSDVYYPGWCVTVDGAAAEVLRVNYALRGVFLDEGVHHVVFRFVPKGLYVGLAIATSTLLGVFAVNLWLGRRSYETRRRDDPEQGPADRSGRRSRPARSGRRSNESAT